MEMNTFIPSITICFASGFAQIWCMFVASVEEDEAAMQL